ncbi:MAG: bifunctional aspartate transaminase/aspartate 4-decarboxylase [Pseudomonadota bacterium]
MPDSTPHPYVVELADEASAGRISRRDFFRYAATMGVSISAAGALMGLSPAQVAAAGAPAAPDWADLRKESPFEIKNLLIDDAKKAAAKGSGGQWINAGRGNPNFLNTTARAALAQLTLFAAEQAGAGSEIDDVGYRLDAKGLSDKFDAFMIRQVGAHGGVYLREAMNYARTRLGMAPDDVVFQLTDGIQGDFYPDPPRIFPVTEAVVSRYLDRVVFSGKPPKGKFHLFATEGATAAMIYIFNSLRENMVLRPGDTVAIVTPIFSPYLELPLLADYGLKTVYIRGDEAMGWQIPDTEVAKLRDKQVKALYMVNPTNPTSVSLNADTVKRMSDTIRKYNPDMVIISDTVYASFVDTFTTFGQYLPENILGVYSFSKYFGVTGWRLGAVMVHENCVVDRIIARLPTRDQARLDLRYRLTSTDPKTIPFYERLEMDSRQVALAHTGGLSGPQQAAMCLFALFELLDGRYVYKASIMGILKKRWAALFDALGMAAPAGDNLTRYYALIDLGRLAEAKHGKDFAEKMMQGEPMDFVFRLARAQAIVCLPGKGFAGPDWSLRVALANISEAECAAVGRGILEVLASYK